jgi:hypothetical protein
MFIKVHGEAGNASGKRSNSWQCIHVNQVETRKKSGSSQETLSADRNRPADWLGQSFGADHVFTR